MLRVGNLGKISMESEGASQKRAVNEEDAERCPKELTPSGLAYAGISTVS